jgi:hypothetical protein
LAYLATACIAIFSSILVYVFGQLLSKIFLDPLYELRKAIGEVRFNLAIHGATIHTPEARSKDASDKAKDALMKCSSELYAKSYAILYYERFRFLFRLPSKQAIEDAARALRGLSTYVYGSAAKTDRSDQIEKRVKAIERLLDLKPIEDDSCETETIN